jgi:ABC-type ATPase with predicted acetyltransferase domain
MTRAMEAKLSRRYPYELFGPQPRTAKPDFTRTRTKRRAREQAESVELRWRQRGAPWKKPTEDLIEDQRYHFEKDNDILALWGAIYLCGDETPFPHWIQNYLASKAKGYYHS